MTIIEGRATNTLLHRTINEGLATIPPRHGL